jgi:DNA-binding CsgD family transcriptional regulator
MSDLVDSGSSPSYALDTVLMKALVGVIRAAAKRLHPAALQSLIRGVGVELGRQAAAEYRLAHQMSGRFDVHTCVRCLEAVGKQFGWEYQTSVVSEGVIRIDVQGCPLTRLDGPDPYLIELGYGILGGVVADEFGYAKLCVVRYPEMPPFHCIITIYLQESRESRTALGIVFPQAVDEMARLSEGRPGDGPAERLTSRETEVFQLIAQGLSDKEIAAALHLSVRTVQNHAAQIRHKLGIGSRTALVRFALRAPVGNG